MRCAASSTSGCTSVDAGRRRSSRSSRRGSFAADEVDALAAEFGARVDQSDAASRERSTRCRGRAAVARLERLLDARAGRRSRSRTWEPAYGRLGRGAGASGRRRTGGRCRPDDASRSLPVDDGRRIRRSPRSSGRRSAIRGPRESFRDALAHPAVYFACARSDDGEVLGYVVAWFVADEGEIANLAVAPAGWGRGIGRALLDAALSEARARTASAVYLEVRDSNERARRLYRSRGFEEVGRRRRYYRRPDGGRHRAAAHADDGTCEVACEVLQQKSLVCENLLAHQHGLDHTVSGEVNHSLARRKL